ncbi:flagellar hook-length control protein FliK [Gammaproteobacteria bacterium]
MLRTVENVHGNNEKIILSANQNNTNQLISDIFEKLSVLENSVKSTEAAKPTAAGAGAAPVLKTTENVHGNNEKVIPSTNKSNNTNNNQLISDILEKLSILKNSVKSIDATKPVSIDAGAALVLRTVENVHGNNEKIIPSANKSNNINNNQLISDIRNKLSVLENSVKSINEKIIPSANQNNNINNNQLIFDIRDKLSVLKNSIKSTEAAKPVSVDTRPASVLKTVENIQGNNENEITAFDPLISNMRSKLLALDNSVKATEATRLTSGEIPILEANTIPQTSTALPGLSQSTQRLFNGLEVDTEIFQLNQSLTTTPVPKDDGVLPIIIDPSNFSKGVFTLPGESTDVAAEQVVSSEQDFAELFGIAEKSTPQPLAEILSVKDSTPPTTSFIAPSINISKSVGQSPDVPIVLGAPNWETDLAQRVSWVSQHQIQRAELQITPAHLGPIDLHIEIKDGQTLVSFTTPHSMVREAIQNALPQLREMLEAQGLQLAGAGVHQQGSGNATGRWWKQQESLRNDIHRTNVLTEKPLLEKRSSRGLVDYFA